MLLWFFNSVFLFCHSTFYFSLFLCSSPSGQEFSSTCSAHSIMCIGAIKADLLITFKEEIDLRLREANGKSHQCTPSFMLSLLVNAINTVKKVQAAGKQPLDRDEARKDDHGPRGGFTDVGLHTGGRYRNTSWPLVRHLMQVGIQKTPARLMLC